MTDPIQAIPEGYHSVTPYLIVDAPEAALDFYKKAFGAVELFRIAGPNGKLAHAELQVGNSRLMLAGEWPVMGAKSPRTLGGTPVSLQLYVEDADATFHRAVAAGASVLRPLTNMFYGDRNGIVSDPFGHQWNISTHVENVSPEEMAKRMAQAGS